MFNLSWECEYDEIRKGATTSSPAALTKPRPVFITKKKNHVFLSCTLQNRSKSEDKSVMYLTVHLYTLSNIRETNASLKKGARQRKREPDSSLTAMGDGLIPKG